MLSSFYNIFLPELHVGYFGGVWRFGFFAFKNCVYKDEKCLMLSPFFFFFTVQEDNLYYILTRNRTMLSLKDT